MQALVAERKLLAYHDRSDGGLITTLAEMAFAGNCGVDVDISPLFDSGKGWALELGAEHYAQEISELAILFNEELGAVIQVLEAELDAIYTVLKTHGLEELPTTSARLATMIAL